MCICDVPWNNITIDSMLMFWEYQSIMIFLNGQSKWPMTNKIKLSIGMHPQLINIDLQEGMVIEGI